MRVRTLLAAPLLAAGLVVPGAATAAPAAAVDEDCSGIDAEATTPARASAESLPLEELRIAEAHDHLERLGKKPGEGVTVAVLDSGVTRRGGLTLAPGSTSLTGATDLRDYHGTAVAGLIAGHQRPQDDALSGDGLVGIAPYATILDVRIYDTEDESTEGVRVTPEGVIGGLRTVLANRDVDIVTLPLLLTEPDPRIEKLVDKLRRRDVVVVASSGNRPQEGQPLDDLFGGEPQPGQDAAAHVFPAGFDSVVAVSATTEGLPGDEDAVTWVLPNSQTDVAVPVVGAVSVGVDGGTCLLGDDVATSWAAAEVSGVLALMRGLDPDATAGQLVERLRSTADGRADVTTLMTGAGVVQPLEALRRPVTPAEDGSLEVAPARRDQRATAPEPEPDTLVGTRRAAVWWGVLGGGVLLLALVLRPLLGGRRSAR